MMEVDAQAALLYVFAGCSVMHQERSVADSPLPLAAADTETQRLIGTFLLLTPSFINLVTEVIINTHFLYFTFCS